MNSTPSTKDFFLDEEKASIAFLCFEQCSNYGDQLIPQLGVALLNRYLRCEHSFQFVDARNIDRDLTRFSAVIVGPGGFLTGKHEKDPVDSTRKWFLDLGADHAQRLRDAGVPFGFLGSGVNVWRKKRLFTDSAKQEIAAVVELADFVYLRGEADLAFLREFAALDGRKARFQPCPSLFTAELLGLRTKARRSHKQVAINVAADQLQELYAVDYDEVVNWARVGDRYYRRFAEEFRPVTQHLERRGLEPVFVCNTKGDYWFAKEFFPSYQALPIYQIRDDHFRREELLTEFRFALGMRLHGWLPYLGCGIPSIFISAFPGRQTMPGDLGLDELACPIGPDAGGVEGPLIERIDEVLATEAELIERIAQVKIHLLKVSERNVLEISRHLESTAVSPNSKVLVPKALDREYALERARVYARTNRAAEGLRLLKEWHGPEVDYVRALSHIASGDHASAADLLRALLASDELPKDPPGLRAQATSKLRVCEDQLHPPGLVKRVVSRVRRLLAVA